MFKGEDFIVIRDYRSKKTDELNLKKEIMSK